MRDLTKTFATRDGGELPVLEGINLDVQPGEIVALLGKSGSGKSTLLRRIAGLVLPSSGTVTYRGKPLQGINTGVSLVFQTFALLPWLTVQQNVELGLEAKGDEVEQRARRALEAIDLIGLDGFESAFPKELSGGMRQRVGFARALVVEPDLLLMDEPFSALDVLTAENLRTELLELWQADEFPAQAILIVTHNIEEAVTFADRVIVLGTNRAASAARSSTRATARCARGSSSTFWPATTVATRPGHSSTRRSTGDATRNCSSTTRGGARSGYTCRPPNSGSEPRPVLVGRRLVAEAARQRRCRSARRVWTARAPQSRRGADRAQLALS